MQTQALIDLIVAHMGGTNGATFYAPEEWATQGERYGERAALVVRFGGTDAARFFNYDALDYRALEGLQNALHAVGYFHEDAEGTYAGIYPTWKGGAHEPA